jgi:hypothetical protein
VYERVNTPKIYERRNMYMVSTDAGLTQNESKFVVEWLRSEYKLPIENKITFWKLRPSTVADRLKRDWKIETTAQDILRAARRDQQ